MTHSHVPSSVSGSVVPLKRNRPTATPESAGREAGYTPRSLSVIVLEPSPEAAAIVDRQLRRMPWFEAQVTLAGTIEAARFALSAGDVDVVLMAEGADTGTIEFAREMSARAGGPPVILVSPLLASEVEYEALSFGVAACIELHEITPRVIETYIRNALWRRAALQSTGNDAPPSARSEASDHRNVAEGRTISANDNVVLFQRRPAGS